VQAIPLASRVRLHESKRIPLDIHPALLDGA
jgi:hypothetical protein